VLREIDENSSPTNNPNTPAQCDNSYRLLQITVDLLIVDLVCNIGAMGDVEKFVERAKGQP